MHAQRILRSEALNGDIEMSSRSGIFCSTTFIDLVVVVPVFRDMVYMDSSV